MIFQENESQKRYTYLIYKYIFTQIDTYLGMYSLNVK